MSNLEDNQPLKDYNFPHLDDTDFPLLENVDVYEYENDFDYSRWTDSTKIYLCNVLWNNDYSNVVKFENDAKRDEYFDNLDGYTVELTTAFNRAPDGSVKVPIPYQVATRYNYMYVDLPIMTSEDEPINYENPRRTQRYYFFIDRLMQNAPNATTLIVSPDNWTTYINNVDIPYLMLERGHAPMASVDVETYLNNPMANNRYLLAPDFDFGSDDRIVKSADFVPINNGEKYILIATTYNQAQLMSMVYPTATSDVNRPAIFLDRPNARYGHAYEVLEYEWGIGNYDYTNSNIEVDSFQSADGLIPNNLTIVACKASNANTLFDNMSTQIPYFFKTIKASFMVDDTMFVKGQSFKLCNVDCFIVQPAIDSIIHTLQLTKNDFGYDDKYAKITKLYTSPYAVIEVTDNDGTIKEFKIENTSNVQIRQATSIAFPYISIQAYLTGINGNGYSEYTWKKLDGNSMSKIMHKDDFGEYLWNWDIPTYALYVSAYNDYKAANYAKQALDRYNAIEEYHKTAGLDNTMYENSEDAADNTQVMTNNSAQAEYDNAIAMNDTINTNNVASANTGQANANASAATAKANADRNAQMNYDNETRNIDTYEYGIIQQLDNMYKCMVEASDSSNGINVLRAEADNTLTKMLTDAENVAASYSGYSTALAQGVQGIVSGGISDIVNGAINGVLSAAQTNISVNKNDTVADATVAMNNRHVTLTNRDNINIYHYNETCINNTGVRTKDNRLSNRNETKTTQNANAAATYDTEVANAQRTRDTSVANANRTKTTSDSNASRTKTNTNTNSKLNRDVTVSNSDYTRDIGILNAQITLEQKRIANQQNYNANKLAKPVSYCDTSGDATLDVYARRGLQVKVKTQADGNIAQAGDLMLRYGYSLNQVWNVNVSGMCMMQYYTYWKANDIWINEGEGVNQDAQSDIQRAFMNGVTIWNDPDKIGKVSIYDNWK